MIGLFSSRYKLSSSDTVVQISPLTFDPSIVEIFSSLYCGARLLLVPELVKKMPRLLMSLLLKHRVTVLQVSYDFIIICIFS